MDRPSRRIGADRISLTRGPGHRLGVAAVRLVGRTLITASGFEVMNFAVGRLLGVVLIELGPTAPRRACGFIVHAHQHAHDEEPHVFLHVREAANAHGHVSDQATNHDAGTVAVGVWWRAATWAAAPLKPP